jgi:hypothetical protein
MLQVLPRAGAAILRIQCFGENVDVAGLSRNNLDSPHPVPSRYPTSVKRGRLGLTILQILVGTVPRILIEPDPQQFDHRNRALGFGKGCGHARLPSNWHRRSA